MSDKAEAVYKATISLIDTLSAAARERVRLRLIAQGVTLPTAKKAGRRSAVE